MRFAASDCEMLQQFSDAYGISPIQAGMLLHAMTRPDSGIDIEQIVAKLEKDTDVESLIEGWQFALRRHPVLRTSFRWLDCPEPMQQVHKSPELPVSHFDWRASAPEELNSRLERFLADDRRQGFDLSQAPLMRLTFIRTASELMMVWTFHHIILDGRSFPIVLRDVFDVADTRQASEVALPALPEFRQHVEWLNDRKDQGAERYWKDLLAGFSAPLKIWVERDGTAPRNDSGEAFGNVESRLSTEATKNLRLAASAANVTMNTLLQGAWAILLSRLSNERDVVFGATRACRKSGVPGANDIVGILINTLPVRINVNGAADLGDWLRAIRDQSIATRAHEHTPLVRVQGWSDIERGRPLFETLVVYEHAPLDAQLKALGGAWQQRSFQYIGQTNFPLALIAYGGERLLLRIEYARDRFEDDVAQRVLRYLEELLTGIADRLAGQDHATNLNELQMLPADERAALLANDPVSRSGYAVSTLQTLFEARVHLTPNAEAVVAGELTLSYRELNAKANQLAHALRQKGVKRNDFVGLAVERNADIAIGILAIIKAGAAYVPIDPDYPKDRLAFIVEDANARLVLASSTVSDSLQLDAECLDIATAGNGFPNTDPESVSTPDDLAYVIYTSGSTGKPKGVLVTHANVARLFSATTHWYGFNEKDRWTLFHSYAFDVSVWELWGALLHGGSIVVVPYWVSRDPVAYRDLLVKEQVTILCQTPSAFRQLIQADLTDAPAKFALREIIFAGEALELQSLKPWVERYGDQKPRLINMYGITETTVHVTYRIITRADIDAGTGSVIGEPIPDLYILLLDERGEPVPVGVPGEIWVGGPGVADGYLNRPELTAQRFVTDPFDPLHATKLYRSGDLARRLPDGDLEFLGRIDLQVKIRGFRIELGEIEAALKQCPGVADAAVIAREDTPGDKRLAAYIIGKDSSPLDALALRNALTETLPPYMIPAHFIKVPVLPLNANGKLDRGKLPAPQADDQSQNNNQRSFVEPRSETERKIADAWAAVLRIERVGADDNFFALGGDSILSIQVVAKCRQAGITNFTTRDLFEHPTVAALARCIDSREHRDIAPAARPAGAVSLTPIQNWFFEQNFTPPDYWNQAFVFEVPHDLDHALLARALTAVCDHHDAFRLRFANDGASWSARLADGAPQVDVISHDLSAIDVDAQRSHIESISAAEQSKLDIAQGSLIRAVHFALGKGKPGRLMLAAHHLAIDGVSWRILLEDLEAAYSALAQGRPVNLPPHSSSFQAHAARLAAYARDPHVTATAPVWLRMLDAPAAALPVVSHETSLEAEVTSLTVELDPTETTALLQDVPTAYRTQINDALLTALASALRKTTGGTSFLIEMEGHGREDIGAGLDLSRSIGWFTSLFPLRLDLNADASVGSALKSIKEQTRAIPDRGLSYGLLRYNAEDATVRTKLASAQRPQILFNYLGQFDQVTRDSSLFAFAPESAGPWHAPQNKRTHALEVLAQIRSGKLSVEWIFGEKQIARATVERLATDFIAQLKAIIRHCREPQNAGRTPSDFPLLSLTQDQVDELWGNYPGFGDAYPLTPMQRLFHVMEQAGSSVGLEQWQFRIEGGLEPALLRQAFGQAIARHPILRSAFATLPNGEPIQVVLPEATLPWREEDWRHLNSADRQNALQQTLSKDAQTPFDHARPPLMRIALLRTADTEWQLVWTTHHLYIDGWSWPLLFREITEIYAALQDQRPAALQSPVGFVQYVKWTSQQDPTGSHGYWRNALAGVSQPTPFALSSTPVQTSGATAAQPDETVVRISRDLTKDLRALALATESTPSTLVQAAWALLLSHYADARDVVFGATLSGRPDHIEGIETLIGPCVTNVPVRVALPADTALHGWLGRLQKQQLDLNQHQYTPLDAIQGVSDVSWNNRLFDSLIVFQNYQVDAAIGQLGRDAKLVPVQTPEATNYALTIAASPGDELILRLISHSARLDRETVNAIANDLPVVFAALAASRPETTLADVLERLPAERRGKAATARAAVVQRVRTSSSAAANTSTERRLAEIWSKLLSRSDVGIDDNFFDAGGQSLLLLRMHKLIEEAFGVRVQIVKLLAHPTIRALAISLDGGDGTAFASQPAGEAADRAMKQRAALAKQRSRTKLG